MAQRRKLGSLSGTGEVRWKGGFVTAVQYVITTYYSPRPRHVVETEGKIVDRTKTIKSGTNGATLTIQDGREFDITIILVQSDGEASIAVNTTPEEFMESFRRQ